MDKIAFICTLFAVAIIFPHTLFADSHTTSQQPDIDNKKQSFIYTAAVQQELARLGMDASGLNGQNSCTINRVNETALPVPLVVILNSTSDTVYMYFENFIKPANARRSSKIYQQLLELNSLLIGLKLEMNIESKNIRLSAVINTDSNFDRKAFRSVVLSLIAALPKIQSRLNAGL